MPRMNKATKKAFVETYFAMKELYGGLYNTAVIIDDGVYNPTTLCEQADVTRYLLTELRAALDCYNAYRNTINPT